MISNQSTEPVFHPGVSFKAIRLKHGGTLDYLSCAVAWCIGHMTNEADAWDDLTHKGENTQLLPESPDIERATIAPVHCVADQELGFWVDFEVDGYVTPEQGVDFAQQLREAADLLERTARRHPEALASARIG